MNIENLQLIGGDSGKNFFTKLPNEDEYFPVTGAYVIKDIRGGNLKPDGIETQKVPFFNGPFFQRFK